jgi:CRP-like cAMP-binding protein
MDDVAFLRALPVFRSLEPDEAARLLAGAERRTYEPGQRIVERGGPGDAMFIVRQGAVQVPVVSEAGERRLTAYLGPGDFFGEMALLTGEPRAASARAATTVTLGRISRADFDLLMQTRPEVRERIWQAYGQRVFDNALRLDRRRAPLVGAPSRAWFRDGRPLSLAEGESRELEGARFAFVVHGRVSRGPLVFDAPALVELDGVRLHADRPTRLQLLDETPDAEEEMELEPLASVASA